MIKTQMEIEGDFYQMITDSELGKSLRGHLYRHGTRPANASSEDGVLAFLTGVDAQFQKGIVILNIYVPNIEPRVRDFGRIEELQGLVRDFVRFNASEYAIETEQTPFCEDIDDINQTCIVARLRFMHIAR